MSNSPFCGTREQVTLFPQARARVTRVVLSADGTLVGVAFNNNQSVGQLAFSHDGRLLLSVGEEAVRTVRRWEAPLLTEIEAAEKTRARATPP